MNENNEIVSIVIGYTNNYKDKIAYISVVATLPKYCGRGYALKNMNRFIQLCKDKKMNISIFIQQTKIIKQLNYISIWDFRNLFKKKKQDKMMYI